MASYDAQFAGGMCPTAISLYEMRYCRPFLLQATVFRSHVPRLVTRDTQRRETIGKLDMLRQYERCLVYAELKHEANIKMEEVKAASARLKEVRMQSFGLLAFHSFPCLSTFCGWKNFFATKISFLFFSPRTFCVWNIWQEIWEKALFINNIPGPVHIVQERTGKKF
jgi:hypothetical protein